MGGSNSFVAGVHAESDLTSGALTLLDPGPSLAFIMGGDGRFEALQSTGIPLGMDFGERRIVGRASLGVGDSYMVCSDGLLDVLDPEDPLGHVYRVMSEMGPSDAVREAARLARALAAPDDVTVLVVRRDA